jgi:NAD(P)-dependent dehydrogenase (short-subunit alcohol dehydrogenase family)
MKNPREMRVMRLEGKVAIVTGAGAGIGEATALLFAKEGASICCADLDETGQKVTQKIRDSGGKALFVKADVSMPEDTKKIVDKTIESFGRIDILFNNAGIVVPGRVDNTSLEDWDKTMAVNVRGIFLLSKQAIPHLKKVRGTIVNTASSVATKGVSDRAAYTASKGAVLSLTRAMAMDYVNDHVRVNSISPGTTDTPSFRGRVAQSQDPEEARKQLITRQPMKRLGTPEEIADGVLFLVLNDFCTGTNLPVDGGMTM